MPRLESVWLGSVILCMSLSDWGKQKSLLTTHAQDGIMSSCWGNSEGGSGGSEPTYLKVTFTSASEGLNSVWTPGELVAEMVQGFNRKRMRAGFALDNRRGTEDSCESIGDCP